MARCNGARVLAALLLAVPLTALPLGADDHAVSSLQRKAIEQQVVDAVNSDKDSTWSLPFPTRPLASAPPPPLLSPPSPHSDGCPLCTLPVPSPAKQPHVSYGSTRSPPSHRCDERFHVTPRQFQGSIREVSRGSLSRGRMRPRNPPVYSELNSPLVWCSTTSPLRCRVSASPALSSTCPNPHPPPTVHRQLRSRAISYPVCTAPMPGCRRRRFDATANGRLGRLCCSQARFGGR